MTTQIMPMVPEGVELVKFAAVRVLALDYTPEALAAAEETKKKLVRFKRNLLPLEDANPVEGCLYKTLLDVEKMRSQQVITKVHEGRYQILDPSCLDIRDSSGMPRLMPFHVSNPEAGFIYKTVDSEFSFMDSGIQTSNQRYISDMFPSFPIHITEHYLDVIARVKAIAKHRAGNAELRFSPFNRQSVDFKMLTRFGGYIPEEVKWEMVRAWTSRLFHKLFIVSEVSDWKEDLVVTSLQGDPLVVGYDGYQLWLIAAFDTTTLEQYVRDEYCVKTGN